MARILPKKVSDFIFDPTKDLMGYIVNSLETEEYFTVKLSTFKSGHNNLILATPHVFFADIDMTETDEQLERENPETLNALRETVYKKILEIGNSLNKQFRVYLTYKGFRVIDVEEEYDLNTEKPFNLLRNLGSDDKYIHVCYIRGEFAARLTPKDNRPQEGKVCALLNAGPESIKNNKILTVVKTHDEFCLDKNWGAAWRENKATFVRPASFLFSEPF